MAGQRRRPCGCLAAYAQDEITQMKKMNDGRENGFAGGWERGLLRVAEDGAGRVKSGGMETITDWFPASARLFIVSWFRKTVQITTSHGMIVQVSTREV